MPQEQHGRFDEQVRRESDERARQTADRTAQQIAASAVQERIQNPEFADKIADADLDSDLHDWIEDELGPLTSRSHIFANRDEQHRRRATWLSINKGERMIAERNPGRLVKARPKLHAVLQGESVADRAKPVTQDRRRIIRQAHEAAGDRKTLAVDATGFEGLTTVSSETKHIRNEQEDVEGARATAKSIIGRQ